MNSNSENDSQSNIVSHDQTFSEEANFSSTSQHIPQGQTSQVYAENFPAGVDTQDPDSKNKTDASTSGLSFFSGPKAYVTYGIIIVCVVVFIANVFNDHVNFFLALVPILSLQEQWTMVTSGFAHWSIEHLLMNMISLFVLGTALEKKLKPLLYSAVYILSLVGGSVAVVLWSQADVQTAGASGAIFGLLGACIFFVRESKQELLTYGIVLAINIAFSFMGDGISWQGHIGGLVTGIIISLLILVTRKYKALLVSVLILAAIVLYGGYIMAGLSHHYSF